MASTEKQSAMQCQRPTERHQLYEDALTILDALSIAEDDFETASRLNAVIVELAILKRQSIERTPVNLD